MNNDNNKDPSWYWIVGSIIILVFIALLVFTFNSKADEASINPYGEPFKIRATCYTWTGNPCKNGNYPVGDLTLAGREEWLGKTCIMYAVNEDGGIGDFIGYFQFDDTGYGINVPDSDKGTIQLGQSIDVYRNNMSSVKDWIHAYGDYVYIQVVDAKG